MSQQLLPFNQNFYKFFVKRAFDKYFALIDKDRIEPPLPSSNSWPLVSTDLKVIFF